MVTGRADDESVRTARVTELLGFEDEVVIEYVFGQLEEARVRNVTFGR
jgi:hypothetical protein|eukprot:COSAG06_NODE_3503_length_5258_cov_19.991665_5_plen_48_part_00